jgi:hypothetical protein
VEVGFAFPAFFPAIAKDRSGVEVGVRMNVAVLLVCWRSVRLEVENSGMNSPYLYRSVEGGLDGSRLVNFFSQRPTSVAIHQFNEPMHDVSEEALI